MITQLRPLDPQANAAQLAERLVERRLLGDFLGDRARAQEAAEAAVQRGLDHLEPNDVVTGDGPVVGRLWLRRNHDELSVADLVLDAPTDELVEAVHAAVLARATQEGCVRLTVPVPGDDELLHRFIEGRGYELSATNMAMDLAEAEGATGVTSGTSGASSDRVVLDPMAEADYPAWKQWQIDDYAEARHKAGESLEVARQVSAEQMDQLLPDGLATAGNHIFVVRESGSGQRVGMLWLSTERPTAYVYDIQIDEAQRRKGFGAAAMQAGAGWVRERGFPAIGLNVFGYNSGARALYDALGYRVVEEFYALPLQPSGSPDQ